VGLIKAAAGRRKTTGQFGAPDGDTDQIMELLMATDGEPPFKEREQLNEKLKQVKAAHRRGKATKDDVRSIEEEYDRVSDRIGRTSGS
jgi:hypothetical protein